MRDNLRGLRLCQAVVHRPIEVVRNLRDLAVSNQRADSDQTPISGRKVRTQPQVAKQNVSGVLHDARSDVTELLFDAAARFASASLSSGRGEAKREEADRPQSYDRQRHLSRPRLPTSHSPSQSKKRDA